MDFLREVLGDELYKQVEQALNAYNGDEAHKDRQVKLGNLASGEYVGRGKHEALQAQLSGKTAELESANTLIGELRRGTKGSEELQGKITEYEAKVAQLQKQLEETRLRSAVKVALLDARALDVDYLTYKLETKLRSENRALELDGSGGIKGWDDMLAGLRTQYPQQFESASGRRISENKLPLPDGDKAVTREDILRMPYAKRAELYNRNPDAYKEAMNPRE